MKTFIKNRLVAVGTIGALTVTALGGLGTPAAQASVKGRRNTAIALGAVAAYGALTHHNKLAIASGVGAAVAYNQYRVAKNRLNRYGGYNRYNRYGSYNGGGGQNYGSNRYGGYNNSDYGSEGRGHDRGRHLGQRKHWNREDGDNNDQGGNDRWNGHDNGRHNGHGGEHEGHDD